MSHNGYEDEEIIKKLEKLRGVEDDRNKNEIYKSVKAETMTRSNRPKRDRFSRPVIVGMSSAAVLILAIIVISQVPLLQDGSELSSQGGNQNEDQQLAITSDEEEYDATDSEEDQAQHYIEDSEQPEEIVPHEPEQNDESYERQEETPETTEDDVELNGEWDHYDYPLAASSESPGMYTLPFLAPDEQTVVNVTFTIDEQSILDEIDTLLNGVDPEQFGLRDSPIQRLIQEGSMDRVREALQEVSRFETFATLDLPSEVEEVLSATTEERDEANGYYLLPVEDQYVYLVTGKSLDVEREEGLSFEETLKRMELEEQGDRYFSVIPEELDLESVTEIDEERIALAYDGLEDVNEHELIMFVEGVLLTAADYGYREIEFEGIEDQDVRDVGPYTLTNTLHPPVAPNYLGPIEFH
ncbi:hypothetical protein [Geomicrobium sp. JCM 19038]|uniref:hypothetical protein n=1 Tax=Geomicrobium sp. JCM 19038 TaxID=1460635 RepID=UPI00045F357C|nr:hypothetical protein [Geomicrobium sp. JCM 19038]GAK09784.1 hypothetical protein JCM19038_3640 [Geomicrobium sp. JCM 19038]